MHAMLAVGLSINDQLKTIGALAGLAAIPGLAVMSLLYFGQAREVKRLREWAGRAPERAAELEQRVAADAQRRAVAQPVRPAQPATPAAQAAAAAAKPAPANGTGEVSAVPKPGAQPATAAAAAGTEEKKEGAPATPGAPGTPAAAPAAAGAAAATAASTAAPPAEKPAQAKPDGEKPAEAKPEGEKPAEPAPKPAEPVKAPTPQPATAALTAAARAGGAGTAERPVSPAPPVPARPAPLPLRATPSPSATIPPTRGPVRRAASRAGGDGGLNRTSLLAIGAGVLVLGIVIAIVAGAFSGGGSDKPGPKSNTIAAPAAEQPTTTPAGKAAVGALSAAEKRATTVAVLNGTTTTGLARSVADKVGQGGFTIGPVTDAADQAQQASKVEYASGQQEAARAVAKQIGAKQIVAINQVDATTAGGAKVVVVVGQDLAH
jgi:hypothetical protein